MEYVKKLPDVDELKSELSLTKEQALNRLEIINEIQQIFKGKSEKKIIIVGPCSADNEKAVLDYMHRLLRLNEILKKKILIIPRIYTGKPRTNGCGYKGILHRPNVLSSEDNLAEGIIAVRKLHLKVIQETSFFCADEMLYPEAICYIDDLLAYVAVGARSVENQQHRLVASGIEIPVGMKNPTSGDIKVMLNAIHAAQSNQSMIYHGFECRSRGNKFCHAILRGYSDMSGHLHSNYHYENIVELYDLYMKNRLDNPGVIIDCNHGNSNKHYDEQIRIAEEVMQSCKNNRTVDSFVKGLMIESYLVDGSQMLDEGIYGKSVTDPCLGWEKTKKLLFKIAENN